MGSPRGEAGGGRPFERVPGAGPFILVPGQYADRLAHRNTDEKRPAMRRIVLVVIGLIAALAGLVWTLQGLGYVGGSFMSGATVWAVIGPIVALAGLALIALGLRRRRAR